MTRAQVAAEIQKRIKHDRFHPGAWRGFKFNRGNGSNKNFEPNVDQYPVYSVHILKAENADGNMAEIPIRSAMGDRVEYHDLEPDERKIRRMKNKQRRARHLNFRNRRRHGRAVHVAR